MIWRHLAAILIFTLTVDIFCSIFLQVFGTRIRTFETIKYANNTFFFKKYQFLYFGAAAILKLAILRVLAALDTNATAKNGFSVKFTPKNNHKTEWTYLGSIEVLGSSTNCVAYFFHLVYLMAEFSLDLILTSYRNICQDFY